MTDTTAIHRDRTRQQDLTGRLVEALQSVWDSHCGDTHTVPEFLTLRTEAGEPVAYADFNVGNFAWQVAGHLSDVTPAVDQERVALRRLISSALDAIDSDDPVFDRGSRAALMALLATVDSIRAHEADPLTADDLHALAGLADDEAEGPDGENDPYWSELAARARRHLGNPDT